MKKMYCLILSIIGVLISCTNEKEILNFEIQKVNFEIINKNILLDSINFFQGFVLNNRTGVFEAKVINSTPEKGKFYVTFKMNVINHNSDTVKIISNTDLKVQTNDGENIMMYTELTDYGYSSGSITWKLPPEEKKESEFLLYITKKKAKNVKLFYLNKEGAIINFIK